MNAKKIIIFLTLLVVLAIPFAFLKKGDISHYSEQFKKEGTEEFTTFEKKQGEELKQYPSLKNEVEALTRKKQDQHEKRSPASPKTAGLKRNGRHLIGTKLARFNDPMVGIKMMNSVSKNWKQIVARNLMTYQDASTKLIMKKEESLIKVENNQGRYVEVVNVGYLNENGRPMGFRAMVDSQSGAILSTWDRSIYGQPFRPEVMKLETAKALE